MKNTDILINAISKGGNGGSARAEVVSFNSTFDELNSASSGGKRVVFIDGITINTPLAPGGHVTLYMEIDGMNYIDFTPLGGAEYYIFNTLIDATDNPAFGKLMLITVTCADNDVWSTRVTYIDPAT